MWEFAWLLLIIGALVLVPGAALHAPPWPARRRCAGHLLVTGVSPRPDATGEQFVTISGVINGPTVDEHVVYQRLAVDVNAWPTMGPTRAGGVLAEEPGHWFFGPPDGPPPPAPAP